MNEKLLNTIPCDDLDKAIDEYKSLGYRLDMIFPADAPREALLSKPAVVGGSTRLAERPAQGTQVRLEVKKGVLQPPGTEGASGWIRGRAGMEYRDLITDRLGGNAIASHIRLTEGGEVPDYVHYHKLDFQMIRCLKGRIKVVYEDQGPPFWLEPGDWVIQPPEIRHRVLACEPDSEVLEISMPAEHETWVEHDMTLPTADHKPQREFNGQRFIHFVAPKR